MKVVQINAVNKISSTGRTTDELHKFLSENYSSFVVYSEGPCSNNSYKMDNKFDKKLHALLSRITGLQGYFSKRETQKMLKILDNYEPNIIHLRNLHSNFINLPLLFSYI